MSVTWTLNEGILTIEGTDDTDQIFIQELGYDSVTQSATIRGSIKGISNIFGLFNGNLSGVQKIIINGYAGNDLLFMAVKNISTDLYGGEGDDTLRGSEKIDVIQGGSGNDEIQTAGGWSHNDQIDGGAGIDTFNNKADDNSRLSRKGLDQSNSIEILSLNKCALDGDDNDNIFDFSHTTLDNVGGRHPWYQRSRGGNDIVYTSPDLINIVRFGNESNNTFWYDGDGYGYADVPEGTQDRINIVLTTEQLSHLIVPQISQLKAYVVNPSIYQRNRTFSLTSDEAGIAFRASSFEQASIVLKSGDELIDITDSLLNTQAVKVGTNNRDKLVAASNHPEILLGLGGNDILISGQQNDLLSGGLGHDIFKFTRHFGQDIITDFKLNGSDKIDLRAFQLSGISDLTINRGEDIVLTSAAFGDSSITLKGLNSNINLQRSDRSLLASDFFF